MIVIVTYTKIKNTNEILKDAFEKKLKNLLLLKPFFFKKSKTNKKNKIKQSKIQVYRTVTILNSCSDHFSKIYEGYELVC